MELADTGVRVTLLEPAVVATPQFRVAPPDSLDPDDVADVVLHALQQGTRVELKTVTFRAAHRPEGGAAPRPYTADKHSRGGRR